MTTAIPASHSRHTQSHRLSRCPTAQGEMQKLSFWKVVHGDKITKKQLIQVEMQERTLFSKLLCLNDKIADSLVVNMQVVHWRVFPWKKNHCIANRWGDFKKWRTQSPHSKAHTHTTPKWLFITSYINEWTKKIIRHLGRACIIQNRAKQTKKKKLTT